MNLARIHFPLLDHGAEGRPSVRAALLDITLLTVLSFAPAPAVNAVSLEFLPSSVEVSAGATFDVELAVFGLIAESEIVAAYDLFVGYDDTVLAATGVAFGPLLGTDPLFGPGFSLQSFTLSPSGEVNLSELSLVSDDDLAAVQADGLVLATLSFLALAPGPTDLRLLEGRVAGVQGLDVKGRGAELLDVAGEDGAVVVTGDTAVPAPSTLWLLLAGLLAVGVVRRRGAL